GTGFSDKQQKEMMERFKPLIVKTNPFETDPNVNKPTRFRTQQLGAKPTWMKPELVCEVNYAEVTSEGLFRQASFKGMREDKDADEVVMETPVDMEAAVSEAEGDTTNTIARSPRQEHRILLNPREETQTRKVNGKELKFTNLSKVYWPDDGITK